MFDYISKHREERVFLNFLGVHLFFNIYVHANIVGHFLHFRHNRLRSLGLCARVRPVAKMKTTNEARKVLWLGGILQ